MASRPPPAQATGLPCAAAERTDGYRRREPEHTLLYGIVRDQLATFLAQAGARYPSGSVPLFVEGEFRRYLDCGILARGFTRVHCDACRHDVLVAFSCKGRGYAELRNMRRRTPCKEAQSLFGQRRLRIIVSRGARRSMRREAGISRDVDVLRCRRCGARMRLIALIQEAAIARRILEHMGLPATVPAVRSARSPPQTELPGCCEDCFIDPPALDDIPTFS